MATEKNNRSIILGFIILVIVIASGFFYLNNKIKVEQHPTTDEWLKVYISHNIHKITDIWETRVAINIDIFSLDANDKPLSPKEMVISIVSQSGQKLVADISENRYKQTAEGIARSILEDYGIAKEYKLTVQFID